MDEVEEVTLAVEEWTTDAAVEEDELVVEGTDEVIRAGTATEPEAKEVKVVVVVHIEASEVVAGAAAVVAETAGIVAEAAGVVAGAAEVVTGAVEIAAGAAVVVAGEAGVPAGAAGVDEGPAETAAGDDVLSTGAAEEAARAAW